jgi:hypothetical protein
MGGQMIGQVVDSLTPSGQLQHPNAITAAGTNRNSSTANLEAAAKGAEESGAMAHAPEERRRDLYRL